MDKAWIPRPSCHNPEAKSSYVLQPCDSGDPASLSTLSGTLALEERARCSPSPRIIAQAVPLSSFQADGKG